MKLISIIFILLIGFISCTKNNPEVKPVPKIEFTTQQLKVLNTSNQFGLKLFCDLADDYPATENLFISPLSVSLALTMAYNGAAGETSAEMQNTLDYNGLSKEEINLVCKELVEKILAADPGVIMEIANSIWHEKTFPVKPDFLTLNQTYFNAEVTGADFGDPATLNLINGWVSTKTHGKIEKIIDNISPQSVMYLINAIYFKGVWKYKFDKAKTVKGDFINEQTVSEASFMTNEATYKYMENELLEALELPYGGSAFSMVVLLPKEGKSVKDIVNEFNTANLNNWFDTMDSTNLIIKLPQFKFTYDTLLNESLKTLGMPKAFTDAADFSNISDVPVSISRVIHKSFVEVNEEGTEAAAVTAVEIRLTSIGPDGNRYFVANRPFIFVIKENTNHTILFSGIVNKP